VEESSKGERNLGALALFEAASLWEIAGMDERSEGALSAFAQNYPHSELHPSALTKLGIVYRKSGRAKEGAALYEAAARTYTDPSRSFSALQEAVEFYETAENWEKVRALAGELAGRSKGAWENEIKWKVKGAEARLKLGDDKGAGKVLTELLQEAKRRPSVPGALYFIKRVHFLLADSEKKSFEAVHLVDPLEKNLKRKKALFERLLKEYRQAADSISPDLVLSATYRIAELFESFSQSLLESERPRKLSSDEKQAYDQLLIEQAIPYLKNAKEAYERNIAWAKQAGVESEWVAMSRDRLERLHRQIESLPKQEGALSG
jgi:hypothetical protein